MSEPTVTRELRELIDHLGSLDEIEVLVALFARKGRSLTLSETAAAAQKPVDAVHQHLRRLAEGGLLVHHEATGSYAYPERESEVDAAVAELVRMYEERPVTLIKVLYDRPSNAVLSFADAFRLRKV